MALVEEHNTELKGVLLRGYNLLPNGTLVKLLRLLALLDLEGDAFGLGVGIVSVYERNAMVRWSAPSNSVSRITIALPSSSSGPRARHLLQKVTRFIRLLST